MLGNNSNDRWWFGGWHSLAVLAAFAVVPLWMALDVVAADGCARTYSLSVPQAAVKTHNNNDKLIIAHRGASYHMPEHSLPAYRLALEIGADFVEPDLVATRDGRLIAMHSVDLNVTTNVLDVFGSSRSPWFSPFANRSGYWTFNFTLEEIQQLRLKQRLPRARSTAYDNMFPVPTLLDIQQLVNQWNNEQVPQLLLHVDADDTSTTTSSSSSTTSAPTTTSNFSANVPVHTHYQQTAGVYAELKSSPWFAADANMNLVDLLLEEIAANTELFESVLECPDIFKFDEYKVPPLVIQCFEAPPLKELTEKWTSHTNPAIRQAPLPPMILLIDHKNCWEETFWFDIGDTWRKYIAGVGMDKACFPKVGEFVEEGQAAKGRAEEFNLVIHPYTERPEHEFLMEGFQNGFEETQYLFCTIGAQGVFSESVHTAIMAARMPCPATATEVAAEAKEEEANNNTHTSSHNNDNNGGDKATPSLCDPNTNQEIAPTKMTSNFNFHVALVSFLLGAFVAVALTIWVHRGFSFTARPPRQQQVPTSGEDDMEGIGGGHQNDNNREQVPDDELL